MKKNNEKSKFCCFFSVFYLIFLVIFPVGCFFLVILFLIVFC
jgi:hypothetical protein